MEEIAHHLKEARLAWERLRIVYNLVLLVQGLTCVWFLWQLEKFAKHPYYRLGTWWDFAIFFGGVANGFYFLGSLAETSAYRVLGWRMGRARYFLFAAGLSLSIGVVFLLAYAEWNRLLPPPRYPLP